MSLRYGTPTFVIPGAQKCGTSALAAFLDRHPRLKLATTKEPDFFLKEPRYRGGEQSYRRHFPKRHPWSRELFFEASVGYLSHPSAPERLAAYDAGLRFVVMVREPARRALSAWNMYRRFATVPSERARFEAWLEDHNEEDRAAGLRLLAQPRFPSFADMVAGELEHIALAGPGWTLPAIVAGGLYAPQLERFLAFFPADRFLVLEDRELVDRPAQTLDRVLAFLGLPRHAWGDSFPRVFPGRYDGPLEGATLDRLRRFYAPHNRRFFELAGRSLDWPGAGGYPASSNPVLRG